MRWLLVGYLAACVAGAAVMVYEVRRPLTEAEKECGCTECTEWRRMQADAQVIDLGEYRSGQWPTTRSS